MHAAAKRHAIAQNHERLTFEHSIETRRPALHKRQQHVAADEHDNE
jgi:hypothetical protein